MIEVHALCKNYGLFQALRNISFRVDKGQVVEGREINHHTRMHLGAIQRGDPKWKPIAAATETVEPIDAWEQLQDD